MSPRTGPLHLLTCALLRYGTYSTFESLEAGLDLEMPGPSIWWGERLIRAVGSGKIKESVIDRSARRVSACCGSP